MRQLVYSAIKTPDGTVLHSKHRHDYVSHTDVNGEYYFIDGGLNYVRRSINKERAESLAVYSDDPHEKIREVFGRGTYGINGDKDFRYVLLKDIEDDWLENIIRYEEDLRPNSPFLPIYKNELEWRKGK